MTEFISNLIGNDLWATIVMSFIPLIELKGGIIFARGVGFGIFESLGLAYLGSTLVFFPIFFLLQPILNLLKKIKWFNKFAVSCENYVKERANESFEKQKKKGKNGCSETLIKWLTVFVFVAIPLPMTGVWMGTAIAVFLNMKFKDAVLPIITGNAIAGLIITGLAELCLVIFGDIKVLDYVLYILFALALIMLVVMIVKIVKSKNTPNETASENTDIGIKENDERVK